VLQLTEEDAGMLNAMLFGDRSRLTQQLRLGFERTGSFHLFVVSGMHVALLAGMLLWGLRRLRVRDWIATAITLPLLTGYALLTGFGAPVQRALFMTAVFLIARLLSRERSVLNAVGAAALAEIVVSPSSLFEASFQMRSLQYSRLQALLYLWRIEPLPLTRMQPGGCTKCGATRCFRLVSHSFV
jgi:competence protein ComEC